MTRKKIGIVIGIRSIKKFTKAKMVKKVKKTIVYYEYLDGRWPRIL